ncbi:neurotransmitter-gated ion-channel ligand-binding protein [Rhizobium sp. S-51]|uniref:Neurotransmitter-gated ion-channel ligand-binding protein n=1 Tax=Rhizobium terricola TaxID=2728849 RepID=A0A7Y0FVL7_9HYPH|nr:neurotransmitter-gated ion-channel ligand-binding protein [Rhizobium terricola]NML74578.1 neurotransmitter-gated ion-channel ligand-binding protein [Rhizobium terricola]
MTGLPMRRFIFAFLSLLLLAVNAGSAGAQAAPKPLPKGVHLPMQVHFSMRVLGLSRLSETAGEASMMIEITERWRDPSQAFDPKVTGFGRFDHVGADAEARLAEIWTPGTEIENQISEPRTSSVALSMRADGTVTRIRRLDADFRVEIGMDTFPFDKQTLTLSMVTPRHSADEVIFVMNDIDRELSAVAEDLSVNNWQPHSLQFVMERFHGWNAKPFVRIKASTVVERDWQYYLLPIFVPFVAILSVSLFILWAPEKLLGDKAPMTYSALLALAALSFTYESSFPGSISMNSPVAFMVSLGYFYLVFVLLLNLILVYADFPGRRRFAHIEDIMRDNIRYSVPTIFVLVCVCSICRSLL